MIDLTIPPRNTDDEAWARKIESRRARNRHFEALDAAVIEAATRRPAKLAPTKRTTTPTSTRVRGVSIRPCPECGHPTRSSGIPVAKAPGTRQRTHGVCVPCYDRAHPRTPQNGRVGLGTRVTDTEVQAWTAAYLAGRSVRSIALEAGRPAITVSAHLVRVGAKPGRVS